MGEAAYTLENALRAPNWPHFDYADPGAFLIGTPRRITCPCLEAGFFCAESGCDNPWTGAPYDCCLPTDPLLQGAGVVSVPAAEATFHETWSAGQRWLQIDWDLGAPLGPLGKLGLPAHAPDDGMLQNLRGAIGSDADGYLGLTDDYQLILLADVRLETALPVAAHPATNLARLYLNALFANRAPLGDPAGEAAVTVGSHWEDCPDPDRPLRTRFHFHVTSELRTPADELRLELTLPPEVSFVACAPEATAQGNRVIWPLTRQEERWDLYCTFDFPAEGTYPFPYELFASHLSTLGTTYQSSGFFNLRVHGTTDGDGDGRPACTPCWEDGTEWCGDDIFWDEGGNDNGCDDSPDPDPVRDGTDEGCVCTAGARPSRGAARPSRSAALLLILLAFLAWSARRSRSARRNSGRPI